MSIRSATMLLPAALVMALLALCLTPGASARLVANTINLSGTVSDDGRRLVLTGPLSTDVEQLVQLRVTVTQRSTGAVAEGQLRLTGTTSQQQWTVEAKTHGDETFEEGPATAVALAISTTNGHADDAHQWLVNITLERE
jgi:hypothetical protein